MAKTGEWEYEDLLTVVETDEWKYFRNAEGSITLLKYLKRMPSELDIPDEIEGRPIVTLGTALFKNQKVLKNVKLPKRLKHIGDEAFYGCENLTIRPADLPDTLVKIGDMAFFGCKLVDDALSKTDDSDVFAFPPSCKYIGPNAFSQCSGKFKLFLPSTIKNLESSAFLTHLARIPLLQMALVY